MTKSKLSLVAVIAALTLGIWATGAWAQSTTKPAADGGSWTPAPAGPAKPAPDATGKTPAEAKGEPATQDSGGQQGGGLDWRFLAVVMGGMALLLFWSSRNRRKQEKKRKDMLASLKKGDKVVSAGGIIGTIIETRDDEILVKVDETNNVRMRFARWAIRGTGDQAKNENPDQK
jgi:preprotein translocase subunit YajC